jgi:hypothetical protein
MRRKKCVGTDLVCLNMRSPLESEGVDGLEHSSAVSFHFG